MLTLKPSVMIVNGHRKYFLSIFLTDNILIKFFFYLHGNWKIFTEKRRFIRALFFTGFVYDLVTIAYTIVTDKNTGSLNKLLHLCCRSVAK